LQVGEDNHPSLLAEDYRALWENNRMKRSQGSTLVGLLVIVVLVGLAFWATRNDQPQTTPSPSPPVSTGEAGTQLAALAVAPEGKMAGYSRERFPHWSSQGNSCDTREIVLQRQGQNVQTDKSCKATTGQWTSPYDGVVITKATELDIDHTVPLAEAWRSGADKWTDAQREKFANDVGGVQLMAVTATTNRAKGDQDPAKWKPPVKTYWCTYAAHWIQVKTTYALTIDQAEHDALASMLTTC
jgi:hypothetical protein